MAKINTTTLSENFFRRFSDVFAPHLNTVGVNRDVLDCADIEIPEDRYIYLWEEAGKVNPNVGLEVGNQIILDDFGALSHAMACSSNVHQLLETLEHFVVVLSQQCRVHSDVEGDQLVISYQVTAPTLVHRRQDAEFSICFILRHLQLTTGLDLRPQRVDFEHAKPKDISVHRAIFNAPLYFDQPLNRIYFSRSLLEQPLLESNERVYQALTPYLEEQRQKREYNSELVPRLSRIIAGGLSSGVPSMTSLGDQLGMSVRTLQRRLKQEKIEYSALVDSIRRELSMSYLRDSNYSITEISMLVGYAETGSFCRAFKRWHSLTPQEYRDAQKAV